MSSHEHNDHDSHNETKPVAFTVPFILASVVLVIIFSFLSMCDPKKHGECECKDNCSKECMEACEKGDHSKHPHENMHEGHDHDAKTGEKGLVESTDTMAAETAVPTLDDTTHKAHESHH